MAVMFFMLESMTTMAIKENKEPMTDEELAQMAREGCEDAFSLLVRRLTPMVKRQSLSFQSSLLEKEDLAQEGLMGLFSAVRTYHPGEASFRTYACVCIRNCILSAVKRSNAARCIPVSELVSMEDSEETPLISAGGGEDPAQLVDQKEDTFLLHGRLRELLSEKEYQVLMLYLQAYSYEEIAQLTKISAKSVDNALQRVRRKMISAFSVSLVRDP